MLSKIQIISTIGSVCFLLMILYFVRQKKLKEAYSILWIFTGIVMLVLSVWTDCLRLISNLIGIIYPPATLFLFILGGIILILFQYSLLLSRNQERISRLAQELAILKAEIEEMRKKR